MKPERRRKEEAVTQREVRPKYPGAGEVTALRMPHDDLIKREDESGDQRAVGGVAVGGPAASRSEQSAEAGASSGREAAGQVRALREAAPRVKVEQDPFEVFRQRFHGLLHDTHMRLCVLVHEEGKRNKEGSFETTTKQLAELLKIKRRAVFGMLERLEEKGFIIRETVKEGKHILGLKLTLVLNR